MTKVTKKEEESTTFGEVVLVLAFIGVVILAIVGVFSLFSGGASSDVPSDASGLISCESPIIPIGPCVPGPDCREKVAFLEKVEGIFGGWEISRECEALVGCSFYFSSSTYRIGFFENREDGEIWGIRDDWEATTQIVYGLSDREKDALTKEACRQIEEWKAGITREIGMAHDRKAEEARSNLEELMDSEEEKLLKKLMNSIETSFEPDLYIFSTARKSEWADCTFRVRCSWRDGMSVVTDDEECERYLDEYQELNSGMCG